MLYLLHLKCDWPLLKPTRILPAYSYSTSKVAIRVAPYLHYPLHFAPSIRKIRGMNMKFTTCCLTQARIKPAVQ